MASKVGPDEIEFQERLELAFLEVLTSLPTDHLNRWNFRARAFANLDAHIDRASSDPENPHFERMLLLLVAWKCVQRLIEPTKAPVKRPLSPTEQLYREQQRKKAPVKTKSDVCRSTRNYRAKIARMSPEELEAFREKERARLREYHKRTKAARQTAE